MYYNEWSPKINIRRGLMVSQEGLKNLKKRHNPGFISVYMFPEVAAKEILANRHSRDFAQYPVYSEKLILDIDTGETGLAVFREWVKGLNLKHDLYFSGKKGYHVEVDIVPMEGQNVPHSQLEYVKATGLEADLSRYRSDALIRLPGTIHDSTGKKKILLEQHEGETLEIPMISKQGIDFSKFSREPVPFKNAMVRVLGLVDEEPAPGMRHQKIWALAKTFEEAGISFETTCELLLKTVEQWQNQKEESEVIRAIQQAYRKTA